MQITVAEVSDIKSGDRGTSSKVKAADGKYYYANEDATKYLGKTIEGDVTEKTSAKGNKYNILNIKGEVTGSQVISNGKVEWKEYDALARVAHRLALELESDEVSEEIIREDTPEGVQSHKARTIIIDRSRARITFVNTALMALKDGKLWLDDDLPF